MKTKISLVSLLVISIIFFLPFLFKPSILSTKDNDLGRTYITLYGFIKDSVLTYGQIPLWRSDQMMGETFIGNPLSSLFYPLNILFVLFPVNFAAILFLFLHFFLAGVFTYFLARSFKLSYLASFAAALFFAFSTKMMVHLEAGHITMIAAFSYLPLAFWSVRLLLSGRQKTGIILCSIALTFMYMTYQSIFYYTAIFITLYWIYRMLRSPRSLGLWALLVPLITFGLSAIVLLPHLEFGSLSTRSAITLQDAALPLWNFKRFLTSLLAPYIDFKGLDHESFLYLGIIPIILAVIGFVKLNGWQKIMVGTFGFLTLLFAAGLSTPLYPLAYKLLPFLAYLRITTRVWIVVALIVSLLAAVALQNVRKSLILVAIGAFLLESFSIGYYRISQIPALSFENRELYQFMARDKDTFRVYCTTYCFNPQLVAQYKIQVLHGETPIQHLDFVKFLAKAGNYQFDKFAVIFPPYQVWQTADPPVPSTHLLGLANVKYIATTYQISSPDFLYIDQFDDIYLYQNKQFRQRAYFADLTPVNINYTPNAITIQFPQTSTFKDLIFAQNYYPGWVSQIDNRLYPLLRQDPVMSKILVPPQTETVQLKYQPESFKIGRTLTFATTIFLILWLIPSRKKKQKLSS